MLGYRSTMCNRQHSQACLNTSLSIRQEIQRFESVHPSIYALYDLVELVPDPLLAQQIRDHVVAIEALNDRLSVAARLTTGWGIGELFVQAILQRTNECSCKHRCKPCTGPRYDKLG
ncbi:hypothetical protein ACJJTC_009336 [Scirpophaga incertulas]